jgi:hypothetical protein
MNRHPRTCIPNLSIKKNMNMLTSKGILQKEMIK